jgi:hypothetical protein
MVRATAGIEGQGLTFGVGACSAAGTRYWIHSDIEKWGMEQSGHKQRGMGFVGASLLAIE